MKSSLFKHTATYWQVTAENDGYGGKTFASPVTVNVQWQDVQEKFVDNAGEEKVSRAKIFVRQDMSPGDYIYLGTSTESSPLDQSGAYEIKAFSKISNLKNTDAERKLML